MIDYQVAFGISVIFNVIFIAYFIFKVNKDMAKLEELKKDEIIEEIKEISEVSNETL